LRTHYQGSLDGLCGAYAVINSISLMIPRIDADTLFSSVITRMGGRLSSIMLHGMTTAELRNLVLKPCRNFCIKRRVTLHYSRCTGSSLDDYWQTLQTHITQHGAGSIVLGITGSYDHWTCVRRITDKTMLLADSGDWTRLYRRHVTVDASEALYRLRPTDTFLMMIEK
jgi:hypothetical protein